MAQLHRAVIAEFLASALFVIIGCGSAMATAPSEAGSFRLLVSLAFGIAITVLVYMTCHIDGAGQINAAVTVSLMLGGSLPVEQGVGNICAQYVGSTCGALMLRVIFGCKDDFTTNIATNIVSPQFRTTQAFAGEFVFTFLLCIVVWQVAVNPRSKGGPCTPIAVGFAVFLSHLVLIPIDGCSINPSRSFGPALVSYFLPCKNSTLVRSSDILLWTGAPLLGGAFAALVHRALQGGPAAGGQEAAAPSAPDSS